MPQSSKEVYEGMDRAAERARVHLKKFFAEGTVGDVAEWIEHWKLSAGYKRLCKVIKEVNDEYHSCDTCHGLGHPHGGPECPACGS